VPKAYILSRERIDAERSRSVGDPAKVDFQRLLSLEERDVPAPGAESVRVRILAASVEHNVLHAALADTIDIVSLRGGSLCPGNCFIAEVLEVGSRVRDHRPGDIVLSAGTRSTDRFGYPVRIPGYDQPDSWGCYAEESLFHEEELIRAPLDCGMDLYQLAATPLRASTAHHLWRRAHNLFRAKVPAEKLVRLNVLAFGGGTSEFLLMLARKSGHRAFYCSANSQRLAAMEQEGVCGIDQGPFHRFRETSDVRAFALAIHRLTDGAGMHVVCDMFRGPVFKAGLAAQAREGVNVSAGWQLSRDVAYNSAALSLRQITLDHVHGETRDGARSGLDLFGGVLRPNLHPEVYEFEELPRALNDLHRNAQCGIGVVRIARDLPESVRALAPGA